jgi:hypothetical protein
MAVWIYAYGKNGLSEGKNIPIERCLDILNSILLDEVKVFTSIIEANAPKGSIRQHYNESRKDLETKFKSMSPDDYKLYLQSIRLPFIEIDRIVDYFIAEGEKIEHEREIRFSAACERAQNGEANSRWEYIDGAFFNRLGYFDTYDGLRVKFLNDLIWVSGPFAVFSVYSCFLNTISDSSRNYYHTYFKSILKSFNSDFILYAHEWAGLDDDNNSEFDLAKLREDDHWKSECSDSLHSMVDYYYEQL